MNFYSSDEYLETLGDVWHPGRRHTIRVFHDEAGRAYRLLAVDGLGPVTTDGARPGDCHYLDFFEPLEDRGAEACGAVRWLPRVALERTEVLGPPAAQDEERQPAPYVDWSRFGSWHAFEEHFFSRRPTLERDSRRKRRKLESLFGALRFEWDDPRPEAFETMLAWKSAQYVRSNIRDELALPQNVRMFRELRRRGLVVVASLRAGDRLLATHVGVEWRRRFFSWVPAYDRELYTLSPGRLLLEHLLAGSQARGHAEFDFLLGDEAYKYYYATHSRFVGAVGTPPLPELLRARARGLVKRTLALYPPLLERARALRNRRVSRRWRAAAATAQE